MRKMKKTLSLLLSLITLLSISVGAGILARAQDSAGTFTYEVLDDGTVMLTGYTGTAPDVTVPATIDGYAVTGLEATFSQDDMIKNIVFESGIKKIGFYTFGNMESLLSVTICDTVTEIDDKMIGCDNLQTITVDPANTVYDSREGCNGLIETATNTYLVGGSQSTIPEGIVRIDTDAFRGRTNLKKIKIPNTVKTIGALAFSDTGLTEITIPDSVTEFEATTLSGEFAMFRTPTLEKIIVDKNNPKYSSLDGVLFNKNQTALLHYPQGKKDTVYVLPDTVTHLESEHENCSLIPFYFNMHIRHIVFPESVEYMDSLIVDTNYENDNIEITVLNPNCRFVQNSSDTCFLGIKNFYGFAGSTLEVKCQEWEADWGQDTSNHYNFITLDAPAGQGIVPDQTASTYTVGSDQPATIYCTYALADLLSVTVDYVPVSADDYTLASGSTVLQLQPDFLNTLSPGEHTVTLNYKNATASTVLTVEMQSDPGTLPEDTTVPGAPTEPPQESTTAPAQEDTSSSAQDQTTAPAGESTASAAQSDTAATAEDVPASSGTAQKSPATGAGFVLPAGVAVAAAAAALLALRRKKMF